MQEIIFTIMRWFLQKKIFWKEIPLVRMKIRQEMNRKIGLQIQQIVRCGS